MALNNRITLKLTIMWYSGAQNGRLNFVRWRLEVWHISKIFGKFLHPWYSRPVMFLFTTGTSNSARGVSCGCPFYVDLIALCCRQLRLCGMVRIDRGLMSGVTSKFAPGGGGAEETQAPTRLAPPGRISGFNAWIWTRDLLGMLYENCSFARDIHCVCTEFFIIFLISSN